MGMRFMAYPSAERRRPTVSLYGLAVALAAAWFSAGCSERVFRANKLPVELAARLPEPIDKISLSGLADCAIQTNVICPGDVLEVTMITDFAKMTTSATPVRVGQDGMAEVPLVGRVQVAGMELEQAEQTVAGEACARGIFRNPCITVTMKQPRTNKITVVGSVAEPGVQDLPRMSSTLLAALVAAGGLSKDAGPDVEIRRTKAGVGRPLGPAGRAEGALLSHEQPLDGSSGSVIRVNLATAARNRATPYLLEDGDVVHVLKRDVPPVSVIGLVQKSGEFEYPPNRPLYFLDALALAGGVSCPVADKVLIIRRPAGQKDPVNIELSLSKAKSGQENLELQPGDTVSVERTPATVVVDTLSTFFRVGLSPSFPVF